MNKLSILLISLCLLLLACPPKPPDPPLQPGLSLDISSQTAGGNSGDSRTDRVTFSIPGVQLKVEKNAAAQDPDLTYYAYPHAQPGEAGGVSISGSVAGERGGEGKVSMMVYETDDPFDQVVAFYSQMTGMQPTTIATADKGGMAMWMAPAADKSGYIQIIVGQNDKKPGTLSIIVQRLSGFKN